MKNLKSLTEKERLYFRKIWNEDNLNLEEITRIGLALLLGTDSLISYSKEEYLTKIQEDIENLIYDQNKRLDR